MSVVPLQGEKLEWFYECKKCSFNWASDNALLHKQQCKKCECKDCRRIRPHQCMPQGVDDE